MSEKREINPGTAMLIEIIGSLFCLLGLGWIYSGKGVIGLLLLVGYWIFVIVEVFIIIPLLAFVTLGLGAMLYFLLPIQNIIVGAISGLVVKGNLE
nr:hypothetical protein [uncultured Methanolobus sp.]